MAGENVHRGRRGRKCELISCYEEITRIQITTQLVQYFMKAGDYCCNKIVRSVLKCEVMHATAETGRRRQYLNRELD